MKPLMTTVPAVQVRQIIGIANRLKSKGGYYPEHIGLSLKEGVTLTGLDTSLKDYGNPTDWWCVSNEDAIDNRELNIKNQPDVALDGRDWTTFRGLNNAQITKKSLIEITNEANLLKIEFAIGQGNSRIVHTSKTTELEKMSHSSMSFQSEGVFTIEDKDLKRKLKHLKTFSMSQTEYIIEKDNLTLLRKGPAKMSDSISVKIDIMNPQGIQRKGSVEAFRLDQLGHMSNWVTNNSKITVDIQPKKEYQIGVNADVPRETFGLWWVSLKTNVSKNKYGIRFTMRYD